MTDRSSTPGIDARLRDYLDSELRRAETDFAATPMYVRRAVRRSVPVGIIALAIVGLAVAIVMPEVLGGPSVGQGGPEIGADGLPLSIDGEPVLRAVDIASQPPGASFLAGGTLVLDTAPCGTRSARAQLGCGEGWDLVAGPVNDPTVVFALDDVGAVPGFVRTSGALTVARVHPWTSPSGDVSRDILAPEAIVWRQPTKGRIPPEAAPPEGGTLIDAFVPDFVAALDRDGVTIAGYVPKAFLLEKGALIPGSPSSPPPDRPQPVYGEDLATLVGHMVAGVGFVPLGSSASVQGPGVSVAPSVAPSASSEPQDTPASSPTSTASAGPGASGSAGPVVDCGRRITPAACEASIELARAGHEDELVGTTLIVVDDTCPPPSDCDRLYPFDAIVVFVTAGGDTTGWYAFHVTGLDVNQPTEAAPWIRDVPDWVAERIRGLLDQP